MCRKGFRHEADLDQRFNAALAEGVEDSIDDCPTINRVSARVFRVDICRSPFEGGGAVSGCEEVMDTNKHWIWAECGKFPEQFPAIRCVGIVWLVIAEVIPDRIQ